MTRKTTLNRWATGLGVDCAANATVQQLEQAIEGAISKPAEPEQQYSFRDGLVNNWQALRQELPATARAVAQNLLT